MVWSRVRGKIKGLSKLRNAYVAEDRKKVALIEQRRKGLLTREWKKRQE